MKRILIVEDDPVICKIYRTKYETSGFEVEVASDGEAGVRLADAFRPDLLQLDLMLPKLNGVEVIKRVRAQPGSKGLPIVVLSNAYLTEMIKDAWKAGATKCISKLNCSPRLMMDFIHELLAQPAPVAVALPATSPPPAPVPSPAVLPAPPPSSAAGMTQPEIRLEFLKSAAHMETGLRNRLHALVKAEKGESQIAPLYDLFQSAHALAHYAGMSGLEDIARLASVLEILLAELRNRPNQLSCSTLSTVAHAVDGLGRLFKVPVETAKDLPPSRLILGVDDEPISLQMLGRALDKAHLRRILLSDPNVALAVLAENAFDLIFLDLEMPGLDGFELCQRIRRFPGHRQTPVVFVTGQSDFESRAHAALSGGNDFIAKPFLLMELAVKALTVLVNSTGSPSGTAGAAR